MLCWESNGRVVFDADFSQSEWDAVDQTSFAVASNADITLVEDDPIRHMVDWGKTLSAMATLVRRTDPDPLRYDPSKADTRVEPVKRIRVSMYRPQFTNFWRLIHLMWPWWFQKDDFDAAQAITLTPRVRGQLIAALAKMADAHVDCLKPLWLNVNERLLDLLGLATAAAAPLLHSDCKQKVLHFVCEDFQSGGGRGRNEFFSRLGEAARERFGLQLLAIPLADGYIDQRIEAARREHREAVGSDLPYYSHEEKDLIMTREKYLFLRHEHDAIAHVLSQARSVLPKASDEELLELICVTFLLDRMPDNSERPVLWSCADLFGVRLLGVHAKGKHWRSVAENVRGVCGARLL